MGQGIQSFWFPFSRERIKIWWKNGVIWEKNISEKSGPLREGFKKKKKLLENSNKGGGSARVDFPIKKKENVLKTLEIA